MLAWRAARCALRSNGRGVKVAAITCARYPAPLLSVSVTAQTYLVLLVGFRVLPIFPIVEAKKALPGFGHAEIVLPAQWVWEVRSVQNTPGPL